MFLEMVMEYSITVLLISVMLLVAVAIFLAPWVILKYYNKDKRKAYLSKVISSGMLKFVSIKALCFSLIIFSLNWFSQESYDVQELVIKSTVYLFIGVGLGFFEWKQRLAEYEQLKT
jgi:hypothetical protein